MFSAFDKDFENKFLSIQSFEFKIFLLLNLILNKCLSFVSKDVSKVDGNKDLHRLK